MSLVSPPSLPEIFRDVNLQHFEGVLAEPLLTWNTRLRSSAGRFLPGRRTFQGICVQPPVIEVAHYLIQEEDSLNLIWDTIAHEMIHYWLWVRRRPYGHTAEFKRKMNEMGVSRYNPVPRRKPYKYIYHCPKCDEEFPARRRLKPGACLKCCTAHNNGYYDKRFRLKIKFQNH